MSAAFALSVAGFTILALLISAYWTNVRFTRFSRLPRQYGFKGQPTAFASRRAIAWGVPLLLIAMLVIVGGTIFVFPVEVAKGDPWHTLTVCSISFAAAQGLVIWLHTRWAVKQQQ